VTNSTSLLMLKPFRANSQEVVRAPSPIFLKFYSYFHYPIWWTSAKFEWNLSRNGMIIKLFSWRCLARGAQLVHIWPFKALLLPNNISEQPQYISGMLVTLPNNEKNDIIHIVTVEGHGHPKFTVTRSYYKFSKIFKPRHSFISW